MIHYQNPRMVVGCLPVYRDKILLCKRAIEPKYGKWTIPAGFMENGETAEEGALRETMEEAGAQVKIIRLHTLYSIPPANQVYAIFLAAMVNDHLDPGEETLECKFYSAKEIPWDEIAFTAVKFSLEMHLKNSSKASSETYLGYHQKN
jgi:ADP-ribose pyrophosphatase YjhB (NUDIX family)